MTEKADTLNNQAILLASDGAFTEAIACFKRAIVIQKDNYLLWYNLGVTYRDAGLLEEARKALATAFRIRPDNQDVQETYGTICIALKQLDEVRFICEEGLDYNPLNSHLWNLLGVTEFQNENYKAASEYFEQAVSINPYYLDALYNLRDTYNLLQNKNGETDCSQRIKELEK